MKMSIAVTGALCAAAVSTAAIAAKPTTRNRAEIPAEYRWDFSAIYPSWAAWEAGMKDMDAKMDAFAKLKGTLAQGPDACSRPTRRYDEIGKLQYRVYRYPQLQRDVDTRDQAVAGRFQRVGAVFAKFGTATAWFTPELLKIPQATVEAWIAQTPALAPYRFTDPRQLPAARRTCSTTRASGCSRSPASSTTRRARSTRSSAPPTSSSRPSRWPTARRSSLSPGNYAALLETQPQPGRPRQGRGGARRHLRRDREHLRRDLQRRAAARLVPRPGAQLPDHARRCARRQRDPARGGRDADRGDARRHRAVAALRAAAQEAARPARPTTSTTPSCRSTSSDKTYPYEQARDARAGVGRAARRGLRAASTSASSPAAGSTSTRTKASAAAPTAPASTASARTCC